MASKMPVNYSISVKGTSTAVEEVYRRILTELEANNFSRDDVFAVHLAVGEAFINAFKHGSKMDPDKEIKIDYSVSQERIEISVADKGDGFDPNVVPDPRCGKNLYKAGGRGLLLIKSFMDTVRFNKRGNCVCMVKYREKKHKS